MVVYVIGRKQFPCFSFDSDSGLSVTEDVVAMAAVVGNASKTVGNIRKSRFTRPTFVIMTQFQIIPSFPPSWIYNIFTH